VKAGILEIDNVSERKEMHNFKF